MKKGIIIVLVTLVSIIIGLNKTKASVLDYAPWIPGMKNCSGNNLAYNNETYGGYYQELTNGKMCYGFSSPVPVPSTSNSVSFYVKIKGTGPDYEVNTNSNNNLIYSLIDDVSIVLYWTEIKNPSNWTNTRCYAKEYNKLNQNIYYQCDVMWSGWQLNAIDIYGNNKVSSEVLETYSYVGVSGIINFLRENISSGSLDNINQNQQETNDILSGEQNYNTNSSEEVNGKEEIDDYTEKEEQLFSSLDFEGIGDNEIIINPNTSSFIWQMIEGLRGMSGKIILLMTSILGLGIIKMVLNR